MASKPEHIPDARENQAQHSPTPASEHHIRHEVEFYSDDVALVNGFAGLMRAALMVGNAAVVIATEPHRKAILQRLRRDGVDVDAALEQGRCVQLDVRESLSKIMVDGLPDPRRCASIGGRVPYGGIQSRKGTTSPSCGLR